MTTATADSASATISAPSRGTIRMLAVSAVLAAMSLFGTAAENHYGQCVAGQAAHHAPATGCKHFLLF